ncbi:GcrA family cell cycle regulator [Mesorhizobium sp.]|uniref:GcrA family cell cycle regulator n=1 Tax=Mesorhizobium sp. TaxID=1871066 RepID=UPI0025804EEC|nr:GcrA family cell cycle regulator [Mesorhizobium sp.]
MSDWTAEELKALHDLAGQGLSALQISKRLPTGRSRNAVIAKLMRGKGKYGQLMGQPKNQAIGRATPKTETPPKRKYRPVVRRVVIAPSIEAPAPVERLFEAEPVANLPATLPITFLEAIMTNRCLHYAGNPFDPDGPDMPVCGAARAHDVLETRYCRRHLIAKRQVAA